ncbi:MAG: hypothetical protein JSU73_14355 [candidate division WOR-3 bacterium]|nr:MAG: hypothetical protein JSU73_14355 [candidate division WOR-3 bacterium]
MIVVVGRIRFRGADVQVVFRELWWGARGTDTYSDQRGEFIVNTMQAMVKTVIGAAPGAEPEAVEHTAATFMRRVETEGLNTPAHMLALGGLLGRYELSDESPRDMRILDRAREVLRAAWWASGLDRRVLRTEGVENRGKGPGSGRSQGGSRARRRGRAEPGP